MIPDNKHSYIETSFVLLSLYLFSYLIHSPHTIFNVVDTNWDFEAHYAWSVQFLQAFHNGDPYPRWMPMGNLGLGEPVLLFYAPLFYYATAVVGFFTSSTWEAIKIVEVLATTITGFFVWLLLKPLTNNKVALAGALLCQMTPMIYMIFHYFNGLPWGTSFAGLAALLYFIFNPRYQDRLINIPVSLSITMITMTHIVSGMVVIICTSFMTLAHIHPSPKGWKISWQPIISWFSSVALGLGLAMVYLFPALTSMDLVASEKWTKAYPPNDAFAFPTITYFLFGMRWFTFQWVVPSVSLLAVVFATYYTNRIRPNLPNRAAQIISTLLVISWASLFFSSEFSYLLWKLPTPLKMVQSPHRFLYVTAITSIVVNILCLWDVYANKRPHIWLYVGLAPLVLVVALTLALNLKITFINGEPVHLTDAIEPYGSYGEYHLKAQGPEWRSYIDSGGFANECNLQQAGCHESGSKGHWRVWNISAVHAITLRLPVLSFPAWTVTVDGMAVEAVADPATGLIQVQLLPGAHEVMLSWTRLPQEYSGIWLSLTTLALLALYLAGAQRTGRAPSAPVL